MTEPLDIAALVARATAVNEPAFVLPQTCGTFPQDGGMQDLPASVRDFPEGFRDFPAGAGRPRLRPLHADDLDRLPPLEWLAPGEIPAHSLAVLYGPSGTGKSFLALDYAFRIAQAAPILYLAAEGAQGYAARKLAWCKLNNLPAGQAWFIPQPIDLLDAAATDELIGVALPLSPVLIVVDTLARCMSGDENSSRDMGQFVAACDRIRGATGATLLLVHHTGKSGLTERGSSALRAAADQMLELTNDDGLINLACAKSKDASPFEERHYRLVTASTGRAIADGRPETSCAVLPAERVYVADTVTRAGRQLLETLALEAFSAAGARTGTLRDATDLRPATLYRALSALLRAGLIRQACRGDPYYITAQGRATLSTLAVLPCQP